ncbi:RidA family protein [Alcaligenaceae bacterium]|nr:RidA family protein [Alcaligenaceae bacterium]
MTVPYEAIYPGPWKDSTTFSPAVRCGEWLLISGMTAVDENRNIVGVGDMAAQARYIYKKIGAVLAAAGAGFEHVVETVDYVVTLEGYDKTAEVRRELFKGPPYPAATGVVVAGLVRPQALIEIKATARIPRPSL